MTTLFKQRYLENGSSTQHHFITKLMLITSRSSTTTQHLHRYKFTLVYKSVHSSGPVAVRCVGQNFLMLYACIHVVSFPNQKPWSLVWELDWCTREIAWLIRISLLAISNLCDSTFCSIKILMQKLLMKMSLLVGHKKAQSLPFKQNLFRANRASSFGVMR